MFWWVLQVVVVEVSPIPFTVALRARGGRCNIKCDPLRKLCLGAVAYLIPKTFSPVFWSRWCSARHPPGSAPFHPASSGEGGTWSFPPARPVGSSYPCCSSSLPVRSGPTGPRLRIGLGTKERDTCHCLASLMS